MLIELKRTWQVGFAAIAYLLVMVVTCIESVFSRIGLSEIITCNIVKDNFQLLQIPAVDVLAKLTERLFLYDLPLRNDHHHFLIFFGVGF